MPERRTATTDAARSAPARSTLLRSLSATDPLWLTRWLVLLLLLLDSLRYASVLGTMPLYVGIGLGILAAAVLANLLLRVVEDRALTPEEQRAWALWGLGGDLVVVTSFVLLYTSVPDSAHHLLYFLVVVEAGVLLGSRGAVSSWAVAAVSLVATHGHATLVLGLPWPGTELAYRSVVLAIVAVTIGLLADRLARQQTVLEEAVTSSERELRWRRDLLDMLAHDLRSPIAIAASSTELLATRIEDLPPEQVRELASAVRRQILRALRLLDDLLDLGRSRAGALELHLDPVDLAAFVHQTVAELPGPAVEQTSIEVVGEHPPSALADPARLNQVLWNLLTNAHRHGAPPVTVRVDSTAEDTRRVEVVDRGPGVPGAVLRAIYEPFSSGGQQGSTGLGLWIAELLTSAQGGTLRYERDDEVSRFVITLPAADRPSDPPGPGNAGGP